MANVATLIPGAIDRVEALKTAVQDLAVAHGKQSADLAGGLYQTISAFGDEAGRSMEILRIGSMAASAGAATTSEAVGLLSTITKGYGDTSAGAVQQAADLALLVTRLGETTFPAVAASMGRTVPIAAQLGVSQQELAAGYATLTGASGSTAEVSTALAAVMRAEVLRRAAAERTAEVSTALAAVMRGLITPTEGMRTAVEQLGAADGQALVQTHGLRGALELLIGTTDGSNEAIAGLFGSSRALDAVFPLVGASAATFESHLSRMQDTTGTTAEAVRQAADLALVVTRLGETTFPELAGRLPSALAACRPLRPPAGPFRSPAGPPPAPFTNR